MNDLTETHPKTLMYAMRNADRGNDDEIFDEILRRLMLLESLQAESKRNTMTDPEHKPITDDELKEWEHCLHRITHLKLKQQYLHLVNEIRRLRVERDAMLECIRRKDETIKRGMMMAGLWGDDVKLDTPASILAEQNQKRNTMNDPFDWRSRAAELERQITVARAEARREFAEELAEVLEKEAAGVNQHKTEAMRRNAFLNAASIARRMAEKKGTP